MDFLNQLELTLLMTAAILTAIGTLTAQAQTASTASVPFIANVNAADTAVRDGLIPPPSLGV